MDKSFTLLRYVQNFLFVLYFCQTPMNILSILLQTAEHETLLMIYCMVHSLVFHGTFGTLGE